MTSRTLAHVPTSRRAVVGAAWAAPVVVLVSAAPAVAMTGPADVRTELGHLDRGGGCCLVLRLAFTNLNTMPTQALTVVVDLVPKDPTKSFALSQTAFAVEGGWLTPVIAPLGANGRRITYVADSQIEGNGTKVLGNGIPLSPDLTPGTATITGSTVGGTFVGIASVDFD